MNEVTQLIENDPSGSIIAELRALLAVLTLYLSEAPNHEEQEYMQSRIQRIRSRLNVRTDPELTLVRPPYLSKQFYSTDTKIGAEFRLLLGDLRWIRQRTGQSFDFLEMS